MKILKLRVLKTYILNNDWGEGIKKMIYFQIMQHKLRKIYYRYFYIPTTKFQISIDGKYKKPKKIICTGKGAFTIRW